MGQVLHGSVTTTEAVRQALQHSQESLRVLAKHYGINQKTVAKWKQRASVADIPKDPKSTVPLATLRDRISEAAVQSGVATTVLLPRQEAQPLRGRRTTCSLNHNRSASGNPKVRFSPISSCSSP